MLLQVLWMLCGSLCLADKTPTAQAQQAEQEALDRLAGTLRLKEVTPDKVIDVEVDGNKVSKVDRASALRAVITLDSSKSPLAAAGIDVLCFKAGAVERVVRLEPGGVEVTVAEFAPAGSPYTASVEVRAGREGACGNSPTGAKASFNQGIAPVDYSSHLVIDDAFIFGRTRLRDQRWQSIRPAVNVFFLERYRPSKSRLGRAAKWLGVRIGLQLAAMDFNPDEDPELMPGVVFSPFRHRFVFVGYGYNYDARVTNGDCFFIGLSGSELKKAIAALH